MVFVEVELAVFVVEVVVDLVVPEDPYWTEVLDTVAVSVQNQEESAAAAAVVVVDLVVVIPLDHHTAFALDDVVVLLVLSASEDMQDLFLVAYQQDQQDNPVVLFVAVTDYSVREVVAAVQVVHQVQAAIHQKEVRID